MGYRAARLSSWHTIQRQCGAIMLVTMVFMVVMIMAGLSLARSVDTVNGIAGNLAFRHAATHYGDAGIEAAIDWLEQAVSVAPNKSLDGDAIKGYFPCVGSTNGCDYPDQPLSGESWDSFWSKNAWDDEENSASFDVGQAGAPNIRYVIQRLCADKGGKRCAPAYTVSSTKSGEKTIEKTNQRFYRITCKVQWPATDPFNDRDSKTVMTYVQVIVQF